ncbi:MAG: hypothetical protein K2L86_10770 [Lachnospiraceae bacterium]|nr:hypothetical protein [Lachnospiraceae bacterium]
MKNLECDKSDANNMEVKNTGRKRMKEIKKNVDYGNRTIRVVLQFPDESEDAVMIQKSVKSILMMEVEQQLLQFRSGLCTTLQSP